MKESYDNSGRLTIDLDGDDWSSFKAYAGRLASLGGELVEQLDGFDQLYWDFRFGDSIVVLHSHVVAGISLHVEGPQNDILLRRLVTGVVSEPK